MAGALLQQLLYSHNPGLLSMLVCEHHLVSGQRRQWEAKLLACSMSYHTASIHMCTICSQSRHGAVVWAVHDECLRTEQHKPQFSSSREIEWVLGDICTYNTPSGSHGDLQSLNIDYLSISSTRLGLSAFKGGSRIGWD